MTVDLAQLSRIELLRLRQNHEFRRAKLEGRALHWRRMVIAAQEVCVDYSQDDAKTAEYMKELCVRSAGMDKEVTNELKSIKAQIAQINAILAPTSQAQAWRDARDEFESLYGMKSEKGE